MEEKLNNAFFCEFATTHVYIHKPFALKNVKDFVLN